MRKVLNQCCGDIKWYSIPGAKDKQQKQNKWNAELFGWHDYKW
jgi:hypothetical protein